MRDFEQAEVSEALRPIQERARAMADTFAAAVDHVKAMESQETLDFCARHLVEIAANVIMLHLLLHNATEAPELFDNSVRVYANFVEAEIAKHNTFILNTTVEQLEAYRQHLPENEQ